MRAGVLMAVLLLAACAGASPPSNDPVRILATDVPLMEQPFTVAVVDNAVDYDTAWQRTGRPEEPPAIDFATEVAIYLGMAGSSSCPETFQHLVVNAEVAHVHGEWDSGAMMDRPCTDDLAGQGILLAVSRSVLPQGEFMLTLREELMCPDCPDHPDQAFVDLR